MVRFGKETDTIVQVWNEFSCAKWLTVEQNGGQNDASLQLIVWVSIGMEHYFARGEGVVAMEETKRGKLVK